MKNTSCAIVAATAVVLALPGCGSLIVTQKSVETLAGRNGFDWETYETDGFTVYVEPGSSGADDPAAIGAGAEGARETVLAYLEQPAYEPTVSVFVVDSRERMKDLIGRSTRAMAYHTSNAVCVAWSTGVQLSITHELTHVVAMNEWGVPERWINEGTAVDATGPWRGQDPHVVCKHLRERGELPSLDAITRRFDRLPGLASYPAAGSFVRYLREAYGLETVRVVWDGGRRALPAATGLDLGALEAEWLAVVEASDADGIEYPAVVSR